MHIGIPIATKDGKPVTFRDRETLRLLTQPDKYAKQVVLSETPAPMPRIELNPELDTPGRAERRRLVQKHADEYLAKHAQQYKHLNARQRGKLRQRLFKKVMREAPKEAFQRHAVERPKLIVPEVTVEANGVKAPANEKRSPGGIILAG